MCLHSDVERTVQLDSLTLEYVYWIQRNHVMRRFYKASWVLDCSNATEATIERMRAKIRLPTRFGSTDRTNRYVNESLSSSRIHFGGFVRGSRETFRNPRSAARWNSDRFQFVISHETKRAHCAIHVNVKQPLALPETQRWTQRCAASVFRGGKARSRSTIA